MEPRVTLEKIDLLRERTGASYRRALEALEAADGDVIQALIRLEEGQGRAWTERIQVQGTELVAKVRELIRQGNVHRIRILKDGKTLVEFPVAVGAIGALLAPALATVGVVAALVTRSTIVVERRGPGDPPETGGEGS